jgi:tRNA-uridine 2-sulfurtransferase
MSAPLKIAVAMSGGVDSSVAAALLAEQGHTVFGLMLRLWVEEGCGMENRCCPPAAIEQAQRVAALLPIPFHVIDAQQRFRNTVVDYTIREYAAGRTPNPCIECNRVLRWGYLLAEARALGADFLATGHYARVAERDGGYRLLCGIDPGKDQSYMLSALGQAELAATLFPLGEMTKAAVREKARDLHLPVAETPDSQDLCFIPDGNYRRFLASQAPNVFVPGPIINRKGEVIGQHEGLAGYTVGQRKGIRLYGPEPYYVLRMDAARNALVVGTARELGGRVLIGDNIRWVSGQVPAVSFSAQVRIRSTARREEAEVIPLSGGALHVEFRRTLRDITPGQAAVFYQEEECLGMALIREAQ